MSKTAIIGKDILHRTQCMTPAQAQAFCRMIAANSQYEQAIVHIEPLAKGDRTHYVTFAPTAEYRKDRLHNAQQVQRSVRGERGKYQFSADCDNFYLFWCLNTKNGNTHAVTLFDCDCEDYTFRCRKLNLRCCHMEALLQSMATISQKEVSASSASHSATAGQIEGYSWEGLI